MLSSFGLIWCLWPLIFMRFPHTHKLVSGKNIKLYTVSLLRLQIFARWLWNPTLTDRTYKNKPVWVIIFKELIPLQPQMISQTEVWLRLLCCFTSFPWLNYSLPAVLKFSQICCVHEQHMWWERWLKMIIWPWQIVKTIISASKVQNEQKTE